MTAKLTALARTGLLLAGLGPVLLLSGCVARREALNANTTLIGLSEQARQNLIKLKESEDAEAKAHQTTREACRQLFADWRKSQVDAARRRMDAAYQQTLSGIDSETGVLLGNLRLFIQEQHGKLEPAIDAASKPLEDRLKSLQQDLEKAKAESGQHPGDRDRREAVSKTNALLLGTYIVTLTNGFRTMVRAIHELDEADKMAVQRVLALAQQHKNVVQAKYAKALSELPADTTAAPDLGPDPQVNEAAFDGLIKYAEATQKTAEGNRDYLVSNSFGAGSFFSEFLKSLSKGVLGGVFNPASVKGITADTLKNSFNDLAGTVATNFKENIGDATSTFKEAGNNFLDEAKKGITEKIFSGFRGLNSTSSL